MENTLITPNQSGFKTGDSCIDQLLSVTHEICKSFDGGYKVRGLFLEIYKAFDKVWHSHVPYKLRQNGITGNLSNNLTDFLKDKKQRVLLNVQHFS